MTGWIDCWYFLLAESVSRWCGSFFTVGTAVPTFYTAVTGQERTTRVACAILTPLLALSGISIWLFEAWGFHQLPVPVQTTLAKCRPICIRSRHVSSSVIRLLSLIVSRFLTISVLDDAFSCIHCIWTSSVSSQKKVSSQLSPLILIVSPEIVKWFLSGPVFNDVICWPRTRYEYLPRFTVHKLMRLFFLVETNLITERESVL